MKQIIVKKNSENKTCVLGLATGNTPIGVYREPIRMHKKIIYPSKMLKHLIWMNTIQLKKKPYRITNGS